MPAPRRKYTRRIPAPTPAVTEKVQMVFGNLAEMDFVVETVRYLRTMDAKTRARVMAAIGKLL